MVLDKLKIIISAVFCADEKLTDNPKWRLRPDNHGTYRLEKWDGYYGHYMYAASNVKDESHASDVIAHLERRIVYLVEDKPTPPPIRSIKESDEHKL